MRQNTWADPQDKYRPVRPESYGPILPKYYGVPRWPTSMPIRRPMVAPSITAARPPSPTVGPRVPAPPARAGVALPLRGRYFNLGRVCLAIFGVLPIMAMCVSPSVTSRFGPAGWDTFTSRFTPRQPMESPQQGRVMAVRMPPAAPVPPRPSAERGRKAYESPSGRLIRSALPPPPQTGGSACRSGRNQAGARANSGPANAASTPGRARVLTLILRSVGRKWRLQPKNLDYPSTAAEIMLELNFLRYMPIVRVLRNLIDAGWSSPVAREAHNLEVTGSNPVPATFRKSC